MVATVWFIGVGDFSSDLLSDSKEVLHLTNGDLGDSNWVRDLSGGVQGDQRPY